MDLSRQLKNAIATGNLLFGQRQAKDACANGNAKMVIVAANCPEDYDGLRAAHPEVSMHRARMVNRELGIACGKPFGFHHHGPRCGRQRFDGAREQRRVMFKQQNKGLMAFVEQGDACE